MEFNIASVWIFGQSGEYDKNHFRIGKRNLAQRLSHASINDDSPYPA